MYWTDPGGTVLSETDLSGNNRVRDVYFGNKLIARKDSSGSTHYLIQDQLGSERVSVSASGTVEDDMDTYPWGGHAPHYASSSGNIYTFTGDENDAESTSFNTPFRQLSSTLGRWLRPDPYDGSYNSTNPQSLNRYSYVLNNPPSLIDPSGLCEIRSSNVYDLQGNLLASHSEMTGGGIHGTMCTPPTSGCIWVMNASGDEWTGEQCGLSTVPSFSASSGTSGPAPNNPARTPSICGGTFSFAGVEADGAVGGGFSGAIHEHDSIDGNSNGSLVEAFGGGEGAAVGGGKITSSDDKSIFQGFIGFVGASISAGPLAGLQVGYVGGKGFSGLYVEGHLGPVAYGTGGYLRSSCKKGG